MKLVTLRSSLRYTVQTRLYNSTMFKVLSMSGFYQDCRTLRKTKRDYNGDITFRKNLEEKTSSEVLVKTFGNYRSIDKQLPYT